MKIIARTWEAPATAVAVALLFACGNADAATVNFFSVTPNGTVGTLTNTYNFGPVTANAAQMGTGTPKTLTVANFSYPNPNEVGLGVCSSGDTGSLCTSPPASVKVNQASSLWDGNITEIDNLGNTDRLNLNVNAGYHFNGQFILGSFDSNGSSTNYEDGYVIYGSNVISFTRTATGASITSGSATITQAAGFGADVFYLYLTNFDPAISLVSFGAGCAPGNTVGCGGTNNDYLVAAAGYTAVPLPAGLWLLGSGLAGLVGVRRRPKVAPAARKLEVITSPVIAVG